MAVRNTTINTMPIWECPACGYDKNTANDYWGCKQGDDLECAQCDAVILVDEVATTICVTLIAPAPKTAHA